jgi:hypothetical protein
LIAVALAVGTGCGRDDETTSQAEQPEKLDPTASRYREKAMAETEKLARRVCGSLPPRDLERAFGRDDPNPPTPNYVALGYARDVDISPIPLQRAAYDGCLAGLQRSNGPAPPDLNAVTKRGVEIQGKQLSPIVRPQNGRREARFVVSFVGRERTGDIGQARRSYSAVVRGGPQHRGACIHGIELVARPTDPDAVGKVVLDPTMIEGHRWCRGEYRGGIILNVGYACPAHGRCHVPHRFPRRHKRVGHFRFQVK